MIREKRRKSGLTALELDRLNLQNKFLKLRSREDWPRYILTRHLLFKYCSSNNINEEVVVYYKKGFGVSYHRDGILLDLNDLYKMPLIDQNYNTRSLRFRCKEPEKCIFRLANITEIFGSTLNILKNGKSNN